MVMTTTTRAMITISAVPNDIPKNRIDMAALPPFVRAQLGAWQFHNASGLIDPHFNADSLCRKTKTRVRVKADCQDPRAQW